MFQGYTKGLCLLTSYFIGRNCCGKKSCGSCEIVQATLIQKVADSKCRERSFSKKLRALNVAMNSFEWKQNEHKILAFVKFKVSKFPKNTLN